jgi:sugar lactone lactonase YvrE
MRFQHILASLSFGAVLSVAALISSGAAGAVAESECTGICSSLFLSPISLFGGDAAGLAINSKGELYVAENVNNVGVVPQGPSVVKVNREGEQERITPPGLLGDVTAIAVDSRDNLYVADGYGYGAGQPFPLNRVWKVSEDRSITVFAIVNDPTGLAVDTSGNVYVSSWLDGAVYKYSPRGSLLSVPLSGLGADSLPYGLAIDRAGNLYVAAFGSPYNHSGRVYKVKPSGAVSVYVDASQLSPPLMSPSSLVFDAVGNLYVSYYDSLKILRVAPDGSSVVFPGGGIGDDAPNGLATDRHGDLFVSVNGGRTTVYPAVVKLRGIAPRTVPF